MTLPGRRRTIASLPEKRGGPTTGRDRPSPLAHRHGSLQLLELSLKPDNLAAEATGERENTRGVTWHVMQRCRQTDDTNMRRQ
jgi:hypothetical protein